MAGGGNSDFVVVDSDFGEFASLIVASGCGCIAVDGDDVIIGEGDVTVRPRSSSMLLWSVEKVH